MGRTTLKEVVNTFHERDFAEAKKKWEEAKEAARLKAEADKAAAAAAAAAAKK